LVFRVCYLQLSLQVNPVRSDRYRQRALNGSRHSRPEIESSRLSSWCVGIDRHSGAFTNEIGVERHPSSNLFSQRVAAILMPRGDPDPDSRAQCAAGEPAIAASAGTTAEFTGATNISAPPFLSHSLIGLAAVSRSDPLTKPCFRRTL
jgi:hypothetical protein